MRVLCVGGVVLLFGAAVFACGAFGGNDSSGGGTGEKDSGTLVPDAPFAVDAFVPEDAGAPVDGGAALDACTTVVVQATADTFTLDDGNHCNSNVTFGTANPVLVRDVDAGELGLVRFTLSGSQVSQLTAKATITVSSQSATCIAGACGGRVYAMRSDWDEGDGTSKGADLCRRAFVGDWAAGPNKPIAAPADYDTIDLGSMTFAGGVWSGALDPTMLMARVVDAGSSTANVSLLFKTVSSSSLTFGAAGGNSPMTLSITQCK